MLKSTIPVFRPNSAGKVREFWTPILPKFPWIFFLSALLCPTGLSFAQTNLSSYTPGTTYWGRSNYTEYIAGNLPLIISAPHGGGLAPSELPNRTNTSTYTVTTDSDLYTDNLARAIRTACSNRYGRFPHVIICNVQRTKVDCNREIIEGAQSNTNTQTLWREFHAFLDIARKQVSNSYGRGLYIDLHGHGHAIQRNEIGYNLSDSLLFKPTLSSSDDNNSTIYALSVRSRQSFNDLVRGNLSLGALLEKRGYPCVPSPVNPNPGTNSAGATNTYFNGGYNVETYGTSSGNGGTIDAIQIECNYTNVRAKSSSSSDSENVVVRATYASNLVASLDEYFKYHLEMTLDTQATPPSSVNSFSDKTILEDGFTSTSSISLASASNTFWGESSDPNVVDTNGFVFGGSDNTTSRNLVVYPRPNAYGTNVIIMIYQKDTNGGVGTDWYYLTVNPVNDAPVFGPATNPTINPGFNLTLPNPATDVENNVLTYQMLSGPAGASLNPANGTLTWRPTIAQAGQSYSVVTRVTDNGTNTLSTTNTNTVGVFPVEKPVISTTWANTAIEPNSSSQLQLSIQGQTGPDYTLLTSTNLIDWIPIFTNTPTTFPFVWTDTNTSQYPKRFYQLRLGP